MIKDMDAFYEAEEFIIFKEDNKNISIEEYFSNKNYKEVDLIKIKAIIELLEKGVPRKFFR